MNNNDRINLIHRISELEGLTDRERSALLGLLRADKAYGLVWEDKPEKVEERMQEELPVLKEVKKRALISKDKDAPNHILIEGDNLEALTTLAYTHAGRIDVIYIDPPYNTGNKDFVYNDSYVDREDTYRHSKWLSFMSRRLRIAKQLLSDKGVIFISIDDNEQAQLKLLCDEIFGNANFMGNIIWQSRTSISNDDYISTNHNHTFIFAKEITSVQFNGEPIPDKDYVNPDNDPRGPWKLVPIDANHVGGDTVYGIINPNTGVEYFPPNKRIWAYNREVFEKLLKDGRIKFGMNDKSSPKRKMYLRERIAKGDSKTPSSILLNAGTTQDGTNELISILGSKVFDYPKPSTFIRRLLYYTSQQNKNATILDFFAGSGTTLHATMQLNAEDGGHRQCILVTNNENGICENVTYERNKRVIQGYTTPKGEQVAGLTGNTLRYYKTDFVPREPNNRNKRALVAAATDLLCIKNDVYQEQSVFGGHKLKPAAARYFDDERTQMLIIYNELAVDAFVKVIAGMEAGGRIKVYVFSNNRYAYADNFEPVADKVEVCALPAAIYDAYQKVLKPRKRNGNAPAADTPFVEETTTKAEQGTFHFMEEGGEA